MRPWLQWIGWAGALAALVIITYYSAVIGWALDYLRYSLAGVVSGGLPWAGQASDFFYGTVLQISASPHI
ncbi:MAG: hypothetical protein H6765_08225 [Candidatus Peribacteria bacterium]|nr:MAG: hypothetical protein H6765_08225 [Candidatus Peribacteria bacterium]